MTDMNDWTSNIRDARRFDSKEDAQARLDPVGDMAWGCKVLAKCVGRINEDYIVLVETETNDGGGSRLALYRGNP